MKLQWCASMGDPKMHSARLRTRSRSALFNPQIGTSCNEPSAPRPIIKCNTKQPAWRLLHSENQNFFKYPSVTINPATYSSYSRGTNVVALICNFILFWLQHQVIQAPMPNYRYHPQPYFWV